jgi:nucleoside-diphosphate-sugar epimerase
MIAEGWRVRGAVRPKIESICLPSGVEIIQVGSIGRDTDWSKALAEMDVVIHLAARVHVMEDNTLDPLTAFRNVNVAGTKRLAQMAAFTGVRRMIYMSSVKVNGEESEKPYTEEDRHNPLSPYGLSKWEAEQVLHEIASSTFLEVTILRPPLTYGPGVKANFLRLLETVARGYPLPVASVNNRRSYVYVGNLVDAVINCVVHPRAIGQTYLVSDSEDISSPELIRRVAKALGREARLLPLTPRLLSLMEKLSGQSSKMARLLGSLTVDSSKIRLQLDWKPPYKMDQGFAAMAKWYLRRK